VLAVVETHPVQYHAPVYRALQERFGVAVTAIYGSDFSTRGYRDREFDAPVTWGADLLSGYGHRFLSRADDGVEPDLRRISAAGVGDALRRLAPAATMIVGYSPAFHRRAWHAAWRLNRPVLFRAETIDTTRTTRPVVRLARRMGLRAAYATCARVLYIGERSRRHYRQHGVSDAKLVFSPYCVDTSAFRADESARQVCRPETRLELGLDADSLAIVFSGKLSRRKGVDVLVEAIDRLPPALRRRAVLLCLGDGALRDELRQRARAAAVDCRLLGVQRQEDLSRYYHAADLLVLPSREGETWGLVVNEALHHGLPCVVSDAVGCAPDLVGGETGVVCAAGSAIALADALAAAVALTNRADVRARCRARVAGYSVERAAEGIAHAYRAVVASGTAE
jgi:glycosyltransferase involved in cell wall biosynthesis